MAYFSAQDLQAAMDVVYTQMSPTPQYAWPLLAQAVGTRVWVKHENHTPTGAFKVRGGITFVDWLRRTHPDASGICTATRGNHGQSQARAATAAGLTARVYAPRGNSVEKNAAMQAFGADLIEFGDDFDIAREEAIRVAQEQGLAVVPPFHRELVRGVATYGVELLQAVPDLDVIYVPIGCGSGICGTIAARDALGAKTRIVGVVSTQADCAMQSVHAGRMIETKTAHTFADGMAVRIPVPEAYDIYAKGADRIVSVTDDAIADAMRLYYQTTHNVAEGAGAAALAALMQERDAMRGKTVAVILSGGNIDAPAFGAVLAGQTPQV